MRFDRKNKGFSIIEIMVVVGIMGILIAIIAANSGKQRERAAVEQMAGEIRDYLIRAGATASKIQQNLSIINDGNHFVARVAGQNVNFEGGGNILDLSHFQGTVNILTYTNNNLFEDSGSGNGDLKLATGTLNNGDTIIIKPRGLSNASRNVIVNENETTTVVDKGCIRVVYGNYAIMIDVVGTGNINMYVTANARASAGEQRYFTCK